MTVTATNKWDQLHREPRHRLDYPSEHVVRFLRTLELNPDERRSARAIDIGCGAGRHTQLLCDEGFLVTPIDSSKEAVELTGERCEINPRFVLHADARFLPVDTATFDVAVAYGVFYYLTADDAQTAIAEMHRVLRPAGKAFVNVRTVWDWRNDNTADGTFACTGEPENGMTMHFLPEHAIPQTYAAFTDIQYELTETTTHQRTRRNSDWLITLTK